MFKNRFLRNTWFYFVLIFGYILLYTLNIEHIIYPKKEGEVKSKIDFIYQQF